jgi:5-(carboxyamino)imidazole ribonucleotide synthase
MLNLLGSRTTPIVAAPPGDRGTFVHLYGKTDNRPGRKMGHVTAVADDLATALAAAQRVADALAP